MTDNINTIFKKDDNITTDLLYYYDKKFDKNYINNQKFNNNIDTKNLLIDINTQEFNNKNNIVFILKNFLVVLFFISVLLIAKNFKLIKHKTMIIFSILILIIYLLYIYYTIKYDKIYLGDERAKSFADDSTSSIFKKVAKMILPHYTSRYKCPKGCKNKHQHHKCPKNLPGCDDIQELNIKEMSTDSTINNWTNGDILYKGCEVVSLSELTKDDLKFLNSKNINLNDRIMKCPLVKPYYDKTKNRLIKHIYMNEPEPWYSGINNKKTSTIYDCEWENNGEPLGDQGHKFRSSIPCHHFPGYKKTNVMVAGENHKEKQY